MDPEVVKQLRNNTKLRSARKLLARSRHNSEAALTQLEDRLNRAKTKHKGDEALAKTIWCLLEITKAQRLFLEAFSEAKAGRYYSTWCILEQCELAIGRVARHWDSQLFDLGLVEMSARVEAFQGLFPYAVFVSPEFIVKRRECGICGATRSPRSSNCAHRKHEIYGGQYCIDVVRDIEFSGMGLVRNPVQKYSVMVPAGKTADEHFNHALVKYVVDRLRSPWDGWTAVRTTRRQSHERWAHVKPDEPCPCDQNEKTYGECCLPTEGVLRPHFVVTFSKTSQVDPEVVYS